MKVKSVMKPDAKVINCDCSVTEAAKQMADGNFGCMPVERDDKMVGMVTDRDIAIRVVAEGKDPDTVKVTDIMTDGITYCFEEDEIEDVGKKMTSTKHGRIPVVNVEKRLVGIVSLGDIARSAKNANLTHETLANVHAP